MGWASAGVQDVPSGLSPMAALVRPLLPVVALVAMPVVALVHVVVVPEM